MITFDFKELNDEPITMSIEEADDLGIDMLSDLVDVRYGNGSVQINTVYGWQQTVGYIPEKGVICVYSDRRIISNKPVYGVKIGDGKSFLVDLPFVSDDVAYDLREHINDKTVHVTFLEKNKWNSKVSCYMGSGENLIFTTD